MRSLLTTKDMGPASGQISLLSGVYKRRNDSTSFIANAGESSVGKFVSGVFINAVELWQTRVRLPTKLAGV